jgi:hypothetical protein
MMSSRPTPFRRCALGLAIAATLLAGALPALAQKAPESSPEAVTAARELMTAAGATRQFDLVIPTLIQQMSAIFIQQQPAHAEVIRDSFKSIAVRMNERKEELIAQIAGLYAQQFSLDDLKQLTGFFTSDIGKRFVDGQAAILPQSMVLGQRWGATIGREVDAEMRKELRKRGVPI